MGMNLRVKTKAKLEDGLSKNNELLEPLSPTSEIFSNNLNSPVFILAMFETEKPIDLNAIYAFLKDDFVTTSRRFSSIMIQDKKGKKMWKRVEMNVQDHVKIPNFPKASSSKETFNENFDDYLTKISKEEMSYDKPLWECHVVVKNYANTNNNGGVLIYKFHHAIGDGVSLMGALFSCFRRADDPSLPLTFPSSKPRDLLKKKQKDINGDSKKKTICSSFSVANYISSIYYSMFDFGQGVMRTFLEDDKTPIRSGFPDSSSHVHSTRIFTVTFSLIDVKKIKERLGVTVNDVVVGTVFLGLHLYMEEMDPGSRKRRSTAIITANARSRKGYAHSQEMEKDNSEVPWGNRSVAFQIPLPNFDQDALANPLNFVMQPHETFRRKRTSLGQYLLTTLTGLIMGFGGPKVAAGIFFGTVKNSSLAISNMIGPIEQMSLGNHPISDFYIMITGVKLSVTVTVMSYMQHLRIGFGVEKDFIDQQKLTKCVEEAFELIRQAALPTP